MIEKLKEAAKWAGAAIIALLYFLLRRSNQQVADLKAQAVITKAENDIAVKTEEMDSAASDYARKRAEYDELRKSLGDGLPRDSE